MFKNKSAVVGGIKTSYIDEGTGKNTVLLIHGFSFKVGFVPLIKKLCKDVRVIVPDLPGFGLSRDASFSCTTKNYVRFLKEFLNILGVKKVSVFGNSMGGTLALMFALTYPQMVDKVIVRSPLFTGRQLPWQYGNKLLLFIYKALSKNKTLLNFFKNIFFNNFVALANKGPKDKNVFRQIRGQQENNLSAKTAKEILFDLARTDLTDELPKINKKVLILWGGNDKILKSSYAKVLSGLLPKSKVKIQKEEDHLLVNLDPKTLSKEIITFVNEK